MSDIGLTWDNDAMEAVVQFEDNDTIMDDGLKTAVIISLFTDRRARDDDEIPDALSDDRRGWWGDLTSELEGDEIGSRLWLLERSKTTQETLEAARDYIKEALRWMLDEGVARDIDVIVERQGALPNERLAFEVKIYRNADNSPESFKFSTLWEGTVNGS